MSAVAKRAVLCAGVALSSFSLSPSAFALDGEDTPAAAQTDSSENAEEPIVVTGIRQSLERAVEIKREAVQVIDSIVAQDISKFPDPTVASALQRVPGVQVANDGNNELSGVRIRGLTDILTTIDGREVFTTTGRNFNLQDMPADALARVDVYKSQTADLIEGGVAGAIDLKLNKPFNFKKPTVVATARGNYGLQEGKVNPQFGVLATNTWSTGVGEIGVLVSASMSNSDSLRTATNLTDERNSAAAPLSSPGYFFPNILQNVTTRANLKRREANLSLQWQASPSLQIYLDGLYTQFKNRVADYGFNVQAFTTATTVSSIQANDHCFAVRSTTAGQNPVLVTDANGRQTLQPYTTPTLCAIDQATLNNAVANQTTGGNTLNQRNKLIGGGARYERGGTRIDFDLGYQSSANDTVSIRTAVGQRLPSLVVETNVDGGPRFTVPGDYVGRTDTLSLRNQLIQDFGEARGSLFQARLDVEQHIGGLIDKIQLGGRFAARTATFKGVHISTPLPFGNIGTATEAKALLVSQSGLPANFLGLSDVAPGLNGGARFYGPNADFLLNPADLDKLRTLYKLAPGQPAFDPLQQFDADEKTYAAYAQASYDIPLGSSITLDGVVGVRVTRTDRTLDTFLDAGTPLHNTVSNTDVLPDATARLRLPGNLQARFSYSKAVRRPEFTSLNPAQTLVIDVNPAVTSTGSAGNPFLEPQKSDSFDATIEHYWHGGSLAVTGYYRTITGRVITAGAREVINNIPFIISRPRNVGRAKLQGVEVSGQEFFDFLPGALSGAGVMGAFTFADSRIGGGDSLAGNPLDGVSKYNFTAGLLYDKYGISGRVVYTYRSKYYVSDLSGQVQVRPFDPAVPVGVPTLLEYVRPSGRLDFSLGYDLDRHIRIDVGGTNVLRNKTRTYRGETYFVGNYYDDETTYTAGIRYRF